MAMLSNLDLIRRVPLFSLLTNDQAQGIADSVVKRRLTTLSAIPCACSLVNIEKSGTRRIRSRLESIAMTNLRLLFL